MIAVDTNILVYAHRPAFAFHDEAKALLRELAEQPSPWAIALHCLVEFAGAVSHPRRFRQPSTVAQIADQIDAWRQSPSLRLVEDGPVVLDRFLELMSSGRVAGPRVRNPFVGAL